ncbi:MAG: hypothetical protein HY904_21310 [Deltaproteobacteria bacterium]|nr:hypothetical protein [Deltaproteobacteria bacterium]
MRRIPSWRAGLVAGAVVVLAVTAAGAAPAAKEKKKEPAAPTAADFLGDFGKDAHKGKKNDLDDAFKGMKKQNVQQEDLAPRTEVQELDGAVTMKGLFVAPKIMIAGQGCVKPKAGQEVKSLTAPDLPFILQPFSVCAHLESNRGRTVAVTFKIVTPKGRLVAQSDEMVDFAGKKALDHVVDYPELNFPVDGKYQYRMEVEGVLVTQQELFEIKLRGRPTPPADEAPAAQP